MLQAILFADISNSAALYQQLGDTLAHQSIRNSIADMSEIVSANNGLLLRTVGDAILASFSNCADAARAAHSIQQKQQALGLPIRAGIHWGSVIQDNGDIYGDAVNIAARIAAIATTNEIAISKNALDHLDDCRRDAAQLLDYFTLKGIKERVAIYRLLGEKRPGTNITAIRLKAPSNQDLKTERDCRLLLNYAHSTLSLQLRGDTITTSNTSNTIHIGRDQKNDIVMQDVTVSKKHAFISRNRGQFLLTDTSSNGSYITKNDEPYVLIHRETITLDSTGCIHLGTPPELSTQQSKIYFTLDYSSSL